jgi:hypothetical protein
LVQFFGAGLGCTDPAFPSYQGVSSMSVVHQPMMIPVSDFNFFNQAVITVVNGAGVSLADQASILTVLQSFQTQIVYQPPPASICVKYASALGITQLQLLTAVINGTLPILVGPTAPTLKYFNGIVPPGSLNFLASINSGALTTLFNHLVEFFGAGLGCTDPAFPSYQGNPNITAVHQPMMISLSDFNFFNQAVITVVKAAGVTTADQATILTVLQSFQSQIVYQGPPPPLCVKYAQALGITQLQLLTAVINGTIPLLVAPNAPTLKYFNGIVPAGSLNFLAPINSGALTTLFNHLVQFFGAGLGCTDPTFPSYQGDPNMSNVHQPMMIAQSDSDFFNQAVLTVVNGAGVSATDQASILSVLQSFQSQIVFQGTPPPTISFCVKYAQALGITQLQLMTAVIKLGSS